MKVIYEQMDECKNIECAKTHKEDNPLFKELGFSVVILNFFLLKYKKNKDLSFFKELIYD